MGRFSLTDVDIRTSTNSQTLAYTNAPDLALSASTLYGPVVIDAVVPFEGLGTCPPTVGTMVITDANTNSVTIQSNTGDPDSVMVTVNVGLAMVSDTLNWSKFLGVG